ncbi:MAG: prephenate dehydrogenase/arogenate dehydrogenase family protein, partial [Acholeplasmatales bacterium]|nr:prephenate dehydrogenase/arogenate dehydrogenase family protein [Acholeplasmatales bacterium]
MTNILIVGLGVIGGSALKTLSKATNFKIYVSDINKQTLKKALKEEGAIKFTTEYDDLDIIVVCLEPLATYTYFSTHLNLINKKTILVDVTGVKSSYYLKTKQLLSDNIYFSTHPMAGSENGGYDYSKPNLFYDKNLIVIGKKILNQKLHTLTVALGFKNITFMEYKKHDKLISYLSTLPHALAVSLLNIEEVRGYSKISGDSF